MKPKIIIIVGPTAVGKTTLSITLAKAMRGEVISADSRQVYQGLDIGSGKIQPSEMEGVPHHLLDICNPESVFTAADFARLGTDAIREILTRQHVPIVVGGTGFYIDALIGSTVFPDVLPNERLRAKLKDNSAEELYATLLTLDERRAKTIDRKNRVRLVRAIEIATELGLVPTQAKVDTYDVLWIGITLPKSELHQKIHERLITRLGSGMLEEARLLHRDGLTYERMEQLGLEYRFMARHLEGALTYDDMVSQLEVEIKKYAKRQMTWFKKNKAIHWFSPADARKIISLSNDFLSNVSSETEVTEPK